MKCPLASNSLRAFSQQHFMLRGIKMIFKKSAMQGNFILSNGNQCLFKDSHYETQDENEISQLSAIYQIVEKTEPAESELSPKPAEIAAVGMKSSASLAPITK
jgi:hypothetical protein